MQAIQNEDEQTRVELRDKIKSKMEVTKFFSGFLSLLLGFAIKDLQITTGSELVFWLSWGGIAFIFQLLFFLLLLYLLMTDY